jgi:hypothetical protein
MAAADTAHAQPEIVALRARRAACRRGAFITESQAERVPAKKGPRPEAT